ncbi:MAG TPA: hypothetical protein VER03_01780 [Bryobacteraceae bacterium]|nr:hypothetical protein [Bryobacteraceae bacterium]
MNVLKTLMILCLATASMFGQQAQAPAEKSPAVTAEHRKNALQLAEISGRKRFEASLPDVVRQGKEQMLKVAPDFDPAFAEEWAKRMTARIKADDFLAVAAGVYAKYLTNDEILELIRVQQAGQKSPAATVSPELQKKIAEISPKLMGEIVGGCTELGAKLGSQVGDEIAVEHPEWTQKPVAPAK